jgi:hypothetical protein
MYRWFDDEKIGRQDELERYLSKQEHVQCNAQNW